MDDGKNALGFSVTRPETTNRTPDSGKMRGEADPVGMVWLQDGVSLMRQEIKSAKPEVPSENPVVGLDFGEP